MSLYTQSVKGLSRAPYRDQVLIHLIRRGASIDLTGSEEAKLLRVHRFMHADDCALEIIAQREKRSRAR